MRRRTYKYNVSPQLLSVGLWNSTFHCLRSWICPFSRILLNLNIGSFLSNYGYCIQWLQTNEWYIWNTISIIIFDNRSSLKIKRKFLRMRQIWLLWSSKQKLFTRLGKSEFQLNLFLSLLKRQSVFHWSSP